MRSNDDDRIIGLINPKTIKRERIVKILAISIITIIVVLCSSIAGIIVSSKNYEKILRSEGEISNQESSNENGEIGEKEGSSESEENKSEENSNEKDVIEIEENLNIPVYSEDAKNKMNNIYVADSEEKIAYLTFDDGPSDNITPQILNILKSEGIKATFFVLGSRVERYPELVKQEYEEGHYIANHGYSHEYSSVYSSPQAVLDEYNATEEKIKAVLRRRIFMSSI